MGSAPVDVGPLLGRDAETGLLASLIEAAPERGAALTLRGEPGIGKTRLLMYAASLAHRRGMTVLSMTGVQAEAQLPFAGLHQLLRPVRDRALDLLPEHRAALDAAFGLGSLQPPSHWRIAMAALDLLCDVATAAPVLAVVDDAHWLDRETTEVLAFIARRVEADPIVLLTATRDGYRNELLDGGLSLYRVGPLADDASGALLDAAPRALTGGIRGRVLREAAGNPLALIELPLTADSEPQPGLVSLTQRLERAFAARLSDLPEDTRLLLLVAALNDRDSA